MKSEANHVCMITNPSARGERARKLLAQRGTWSKWVTIMETSAPGDAENLATQAMKQGFTTIIAAGGDGTVFEVLNGTMKARSFCPDVRLGVLPLGTVNVFAKELGMPLDLQKCMDVFRRNRTKQIDLPQVKYTYQSQKKERFFSQLGGAGLDAFAIDEVDWNLKKKLGPIAYIVAGLKVIRKPLPLLTCTSAEGEVIEGPLVLIGNGRFYGGRFRLFPDGNLCDGLLHAIVFHRLNWTQLPWRGLGLFRDSLHRQSGVTYLKSKHFSLDGSSLIPFELEGESIGSLPARFRISEHQLNVIVP